jgi:hypothetical protein
MQCADIRRERSGKQEGTLIKGYIDPRQRPEIRRMFHHPFVPEDCKGQGRGRCRAHVWERDWLEPPIMSAIRELATHPELLRQLAVAARHTVASTSSVLDPEQRSELNAELERLGRAAEIATEKYVSDIADGHEGDVDAHDMRIRSLSNRAGSIQARLDADDAQADGGDEIGRERRVDDFLEIMTIETPHDPLLKQLRARIFQRIVQRVEVDDCGEGPIRITLYGHLVPETAPLAAANPIHASADLLDNYAAVKAGTAEAGEVEEYGRGGASESSDTDLALVKGKSVWEEYPFLLKRAGHLARAAHKRGRINDIAWHQRRIHAHNEGDPSWIRVIEAYAS